MFNSYFLIKKQFSSMRMFTKILFCVSMFLALTNLSAQQDIGRLYTFSQSAGTYTPLTGATNAFGTTTGAGLDDNTSAVITIPTMTYGVAAANGFSPFVASKMIINANGYVTIGGATMTAGSTSYTPLSGGAANATLCPFGKDMGGVNATSNVVYLISGTDVYVEWVNMSAYAAGIAMNFQLVIHTATSTIDFIYGSTATPTSTTAQVGIKGGSAIFPTNLMNRTILTNTVTPLAANNWDTTSPGNAASSTMSFATLTAPVAVLKPTSGLTFTFTPSAQCSMPATSTIVATAGITGTTAALAWTAASPVAASGYDIRWKKVGASNATFTTASVAAGVLTYTATGLVGNSAYQFEVRGNCGAGTTSDWSNARTFVTGCDVAPAAGTLPSTIVGVCAGLTTTLATTGTASGTGITYQWEESDDNGVADPWANATGGSGLTTTSHTTRAFAGVGVPPTIYYRMKASCYNALNNYTTAIQLLTQEPTLQAKNIIASTLASTNITLGVTAGNGARRAIYMNSTNSFTAPANGVALPTAATLWANAGQQLVADGTGTTVSITGLTQGTTYYFAVYEYNQCTAPNNFFLTASAVDNPKAFTTTPFLAYTATRTTGTAYTPITGNAFSGWVNTSGDDNTSNATNIGFNFTLQGKTYTQFRACSNGWMTLDATQTSTAYSNVMPTSSPNTVLAPFWDDLVFQGQVFASAGQGLRYELTGTAPNRVLTVQWSEIEVFNYPGPSLNFQVKLYETTNKIEYVYGKMQGFDGTQNYNFTYTQGIQGVNTGATDFIASQEHNTDRFSGVASNALSVPPACYSTYAFVPGAIVAGTTKPAITNNEATTAITLSVPASLPTEFCDYYTSKGATASAGIALCTAATAGTPDDDVWFKFTIPTVTNINIKLFPNGGYNGVVQLFSDQGITSLACVNAAGAGLTETLTSPNLPAGTYYVRVYDSGTGAGTIPSDGYFVLSVYGVPPPPANDDCAAAKSVEELNGNAGTLKGTAGTALTSRTTAGALASTSSLPTCNTPTGDVWYKFKAQPIKKYTVNVQGQGSFNPAIQIFDGGVDTTSACASSTAIVCQNLTTTGGLESYTLTTAIPGNYYYVRVSHAPGGYTASTHTIDVIAECIAPTAPVIANITRTTADFSWTAVGTDHVVEYGPAATLTTPGTGQGTTVTVPAASSYAFAGLIANTAYVAYVKTDCGAGSSSVWSNAVPFHTNRQNDECDTPTALTVNANDNCTATTASGTDYAVVAGGAAAASCQATGDEDDVWFSFVASASGNNRISLSGNTTPMAIVAYSGSCNSYTPIACTAGQPSLTLSGLTAGNTYTIRVFTTSLTAKTAFNICVSTPASCSAGGVTASTATSDISSLCSGGDVVLKATNLPTAAGLTFKWQQKSVTATVWSDLLNGAGTAALTYHTETALSVLVDTKYRYQATCAATTTGTPSNEVDVLIIAPVAGTASTSSNNLCTGYITELYIQGSQPSGSVMYEWEQSSPGAGVWTSTGTFTQYYLITVTQAMDYRCVVTCGATVDYSNIIEQKIISGSVCSLCGPNATVPTNLGGFTGNDITNVNLNTLANVTSPGTSPTANGSYYTFYPPAAPATTQLMEGTTTNLIVSTEASSIVSCWLDINQNGTFETTEWQQVYTTGVSGAVGITIPNGTTPGFVALRIRSRGAFNTNGAGDACTTFGSGETEDYVIEVIPAPPCAGTPNAGVASASLTAVCPNTTTVLSATGLTNGPTITYQWQESPAGTNTWAPAAGVSTNATYTATITVPMDFRLISTCTVSNLSATSNVVSTTMNSGIACYCRPTVTLGCTDGDVIAQVQIRLGTNAPLLDNNSGTGCPGGTTGYSDYTTSVTSSPMNAGTTYSCRVWAGQYGENYAAWIDFNDDNDFDDAGERIGYTTTTVAGSGSIGVLGSSAAFPISLPCNPPVGNHFMRVRAVFGLTSGAGILPCSNATYGETEDYLVNIAPAPPCPQPSALTATGITKTGATLAWTIGCAEVEWDVHVTTVTNTPPTGTPSNPGVTTNVGTSITGLTAGTNYEYWVRAVCTTGSVYSAWTGPFAFATTPDGDEACDAITLTVNAAPVAGITNGYTTGLYEPASFSCSAPNNTMWYKFVPIHAYQHEIVISNPAASTSGLLDSWVTVFTAGSCPVPVYTGVMSCIQGCTGFANSAVTLSISANPLTVGQEYLIYIDGFGGSVGAFNIQVKEIIPPDPSLSAKVFLANVDPTTGLMPVYYTDPANAAAQVTPFPLTEPYVGVYPHITTVGTTVTNPAPPLTTTTAALTNVATPSNSIVDWVFVELHVAPLGSNTVHTSRAALLQADGDIVDTDGVSPLAFPGLTPGGGYYVCVRHRNNLGFGTADLITLNAGPNVLNFTNITAPVLYGIAPNVLAQGSTSVYVMNSGDANADGSLDGSDSAVWQIQNGSFDDYSLYSDYNLDGSIDGIDSAIWELNNGKYEELP
jgi:hypothetical protein